MEKMMIMMDKNIHEETLLLRNLMSTPLPRITLLIVRIPHTLTTWLLHLQNLPRLQKLKPVL